MKCSVPEISWHNREPVLSVDIHPLRDEYYKLVTGGADHHVLIWQLKISRNGAVEKEVLADLTRHQRAVNAVRWSPNGQLLATADDDANIIIWYLKTDNVPLLEELNDKEIWIVKKVLRGHKEDIYDISWSPNGLKLLSGSIDNTAILWDITKFQNEQILTDHKGFVQGVCWDPKGHYIATISTDRICRIYDSTAKHIVARISKGTLPVSDNHHLYNKEVKYFHDDTFKSFFRRLHFSPDGSLLAVPSGRIDTEDGDIVNVTLVFAVDNWTSPVIILPTKKQCSTVVRFCPVLFEHHGEGPDSIVSLPYRMIFAVGTDHDIILYDTQQTTPFAYFHNIHYTRLTDLTWSSDGLLLVASSTDGYCALITFEPEELGKEYIKEESEVEDNILNVSGCEELEESINEDVVKEEKPKKPTLLEKWTIKTPKKRNCSSPINDESKTVKIENNEKEIKDKTKQTEDKQPICQESQNNVEKEENSSELNKNNDNTNLAKTETDKVTEENGTKKKIKRIIPIKIKLQEKPESPKRIKPIPVKDDKMETITLNKLSSSPTINIKTPMKDKSETKEKKVITPQSLKKETRVTSKRNGTLLTFLKGIPQEKKNKNVEKPSIVLDEVEARDAWSTDGNNTIDITEDSVESFTLQLDETVSHIETEVKNIEKQSDKSETINKATLDNSEDKVNGGKSKNVTETNDTSKINVEPVQTTNQLEKPKKRVPLITLSSPKQKKPVT